MKSKLLKPLGVLGTALAFLLIMSLQFTACTKEESSPGGGGGGGQLEIEGDIVGSWETSELPVDVQEKFKKMEFTVTESYEYVWKWHKNDGTIITYSGFINVNETTDKYASGSRYWDININVTHIDGDPAQGGWLGIFTYENENNLFLNVEPAVTGWPKHPSTYEGLGSGFSDDQSIYDFDRK